jgi:hypothetical protein
VRKATIISATFLVVFGLTFGIVVGLSNQAKAIPPCGSQCLTRTVWSHYTGPLCPGSCPGSDIYYIYRQATCIGGPLNCPIFTEVFACWDGVGPFGCVLY